ncbi:hypothetical protein [Paenibacillus sp. ACRRY]|nr:hypothetical protein [Paenibacillus sp. ACRRY]
MNWIRVHVCDREHGQIALRVAIRNRAEVMRLYTPVCSDVGTFLPLV